MIFGIKRKKYYPLSKSKSYLNGKFFVYCKNLFYPFPNFPIVFMLESEVNLCSFLIAFLKLIRKSSLFDQIKFKVFFKKASNKPVKSAFFLPINTIRRSSTRITSQHGADNGNVNE